jgi:hypothetical protein
VRLEGRREQVGRSRVVRHKLRPARVEAEDGVAEEGVCAGCACESEDDAEHATPDRDACELRRGADSVHFFLVSEAHNWRSWIAGWW